MCDSAIVRHSCDHIPAVNHAHALYCKSINHESVFFQLPLVAIRSGGQISQRKLLHGWSVDVINGKMSCVWTMGLITVMIFLE